MSRTSAVSAPATSYPGKSEVTRKPLESERWAGCIDAIAGMMLGRVLWQMRYGASVAAVGLTGGAAIDGALITPFHPARCEPAAAIRRPRGSPEPNRPRSALKKIESMIEAAALSDLPQLGAAILEGQVRGRIVVDVNALGSSNHPHSRETCTTGSHRSRSGHGRLQHRTRWVASR